MSNPDELVMIAFRGPSWQRRAVKQAALDDGVSLQEWLQRVVTEALGESTRARGRRLAAGWRAGK